MQAVLSYIDTSGLFFVSLDIKIVLMKQRVYIDTSVIGGCFDEEFQDWSIRLINEIETGQIIAVISIVFRI